jgi:hypothetical protein
MKMVVSNFALGCGFIRFDLGNVADPDQDPALDPDPSIMQKIVRKTLIPTICDSLTFYLQK